MENSSIYSRVNNIFRDAFKKDGIVTGLESILQNDLVKQEVQRLGSVLLPARDQEFRGKGYLVLTPEGLHFETPYRHNGIDNRERELIASWNDSIQNLPQSDLQVLSNEAEYGYTSAFNSYLNRKIKMNGW